MINNSIQKIKFVLISFSLISDNEIFLLLSFENETSLSDKDIKPLIT